MVEFNSEKYTVKSGDCAWNAAKKTLKARGLKVTNAEITKEMQRLAKLNGCDSVEDFNTKYFSRAGSEFIYDKKEAAAPKSKIPVAPADTLNRDTAAVQDNTRVARNSIQVDTTKSIKKPLKVKNPKKYQKKSIPKLTAKEQEVLHINAMKNDTDKIIEYNKKNYQGKYYAIIDKKACKLRIYNKSGKVIKSYTVGVGKKVGDNLGSYYMERAQKTKDAWKAEQGRYTTPGEFTLDEVHKTSSAYTGKDGKPKIMHLKGDNRGVRSGSQAIHMLYKPDYNRRKAAIDSPGLADNRMSYGCVNLTEEDYNDMYQYIGEGDKVYILPEEEGNKLQLEKQKDGTYKFEQLYHRDQQRGISKEVASRVNYDVKPKKNPVYIANQKKKQEAEQQRLLAEQQKQKEFSVFKPWTWFS